METANTGEVVATGELFKQGRGKRKTWNLRKFTLVGAYLVYYDQQNRKKGDMDITGCTVERRTAEQCQMPPARHAFAITGPHPQQHLLVSASNEKSRTLWMDLLEKQINEYKDGDRKYLLRNEKLMGKGSVKRVGLLGWTTPVRILFTNFPRILVLDVNGQQKEIIQFNKDALPKFEKLDGLRFRIVGGGRELRACAEVANDIDYWAACLTTLQSTALYDPNSSTRQGNCISWLIGRDQIEIMENGVVKLWSGSTGGSDADPSDGFEGFDDYAAGGGASPNSTSEAAAGGHEDDEVDDEDAEDDGEEEVGDVDLGEPVYVDENGVAYYMDEDGNYFVYEVEGEEGEEGEEAEKGEEGDFNEEPVGDSERIRGGDGCGCDVQVTEEAEVDNTNVTAAANLSESGPAAATAAAAAGVDKQESNAISEPQSAQPHAARETASASAQSLPAPLASETSQQTTTTGADQVMPPQGPSDVSTSAGKQNELPSEPQAEHVHAIPGRVKRIVKAPVAKRPYRRKSLERVADAALATTALKRHEEKPEAVRVRAVFPPKFKPTTTGGTAGSAGANGAAAKS